MSDDSMRDLPLGFRKRGLKTAKLLAKTGMQLAARTVGLSGAAEEGKAVAAAEALLSELDALKGLSMKIGQMVSYLDGSLPPAARHVLSKLQSQSKPMAYDVVAHVISEDLGRPPEALFERFDPEPFAAASIGQVHRATLAGRAVAVKVKYPAIDKAIAADVATIRQLTSLFSLLSPIDIGALIEEVAARVGEECDYLREADNQEAMAQILGTMPDVSIPAVLRSHCGRSVLTTELSSAARFDPFVATADQHTRDRAGLAIFRACFNGIFIHGAYNADPHPGNYLFAPDGRVTLLDFGCVKWFDAEFVARWKQVAKSVLDADRAAFRTAFTEAGLVRKPKSFDYDHQYEATRFLYRPFLSDEPFAFDAAFISEVHDKLVFKNKNKLTIDLPPDWLFVNRLQFGLFSVLHHLGACVLWRDTFRAAIEGAFEPSRRRSAG